MGQTGEKCVSVSIMGKTKKVLITGASGFTGRHLFALLASLQTTELILADHTNPTVSDPRFRLCDFVNAPAAAKLIGSIRPDAIYHLVGSYTNRFDTDYASNVITTRNILDALR